MNSGFEETWSERNLETEKQQTKQKSKKKKKELPNSLILTCVSWFEGFDVTGSFIVVNAHLLA